jgi:predicted glycosyltransferase
VDLSPIRRAFGRLRPVGPGREIAAVLEERRRALVAAVAEVAPDALIIEHFPFSKWELAGEALAAIEAARSANPAVTVICSLRDIALKGRYDGAAAGEDGDARDRAVCETLRARFDALLVHGDPAVTRLEEQIGFASRIPVPVAYTGYVSRKAESAGGGPGAPAGTVLVSVGGGAEAEGLIVPCLAAWRLLRARGTTGGRTLTAFAGPLVEARAFRALERACAAEGAVLRPFTPDLLGQMAAADLSISRAGYNTCTNVLEVRARALLVPSPLMSDQRLRARRLAELGIVETLDPEDASPERLAAAILRALERPRPQHAVDLGGAERTRALVEALVARARPAVSAVPC